MSDKIFGLSRTTFIILTILIIWTVFFPNGFSLQNNSEEEFTGSCGHNYDIPTKPKVNITETEELPEDDDKIKVYNFNTSWCGYSIEFQPEWDKFCDHVKNNKKYSNVVTKDVKCEAKENGDLCKKYPVRGFPTVLLVYKDFVKEHDLGRTQEDLVKSCDSFLSSL